MNDVRFVISEEEDLASGLGARLDHCAAFVQQFFYGEKRTKPLTQTPEGGQSAPLASLIKAVHTFTRPTPQLTS